MIRVPHLMSSGGPTFAPPLNARRDPPWALELADGNRCVRSYGAVDSVRTKHGWLQIAFNCEGGEIFLLRNLKRGRVWRISAAKWTGHRYERLGNRVVRRAIFPSLPPAVRKRNCVVREAAEVLNLLARVLGIPFTVPPLD